MKSHLTVSDLKGLFLILDRTPTKESSDLQQKVNLEIARRAGEVEFGARIFTFVLPLYEMRTLVKGKNAGKQVKDILAPTLNEYGSMQTWRRHLLYGALDMRILQQSAGRLPQLQANGRRRGVSVTRFSARSPDEISVDVIGGKVPIDRLVRAGILSGDQEKHVAREAAWEQCKKGEGKLVIDVFELVAQARESA